MRLKCTVSYDGTNYNGYQIQPHAKSIQAEIEKALKRIHKGLDIKTHGSGRTDSGVHANGQVFHFDTEKNLDELAWKKAINFHLSDGIYITSVCKVEDDFHARYDAESKQYIYMVNTNKDINIFKRNFELHYPYPMKFEKIKSAAEHFKGTHDFTSFCSHNPDVTNRVRTIYSIDITDEGGVLTFKIHGNGFLYNMVRIIVGTLLDVGRGKYRPEEIPLMIEARERTAAGSRAPAHGLYLDFVNYEKKPENL